MMMKMRRKMKRREANKRADITVHEAISSFSFGLSIREAHLAYPIIFILTEEEENYVISPPANSLVIYDMYKVQRQHSSNPGISSQKIKIKIILVLWSHFPKLIAPPDEKVI